MESSATTTRDPKYVSGKTQHYLDREEAPLFRQNFNRASFAFKHHLAGHPLFEMPRLIDLAKEVVRSPKGNGIDEIYFDVGDVKVSGKWVDLLHPSVAPEEIIERIHTSGAWMLIRRAELVEDYRLMLEECMREAQDMLQLDLDSVMSVKNALVFITSPDRVTPYHIDRECNFLFQVSGEKSISIFDKNDRAVLPEEELEEYWAVDNNAARYKPDLQDRARVYRMTPGSGVHIPVNAPHWVKNGPTPSVSLSINFQYRARTKSDVYRTNFYLRRLGFKPKPPGHSETADGVKRRLLPALEGAYRWVGEHKDIKRRVAKLVGRTA